MQWWCWKDENIIRMKVNHLHLSGEGYPMGLKHWQGRHVLYDIIIIGSKDCHDYIPVFTVLGAHTPSLFFDHIRLFLGLHEFGRVCPGSRREVWPSVGWLVNRRTTGTRSTVQGTVYGVPGTTKPGTGGRLRPIAQAVHERSKLSPAGLFKVSLLNIFNGTSQSLPLIINTVYLVFR